MVCGQAQGERKGFLDALLGRDGRLATTDSGKPTEC